MAAATSPPAAETDGLQGQNKVAVQSKFQSFLSFLYNSKEGTVLGRTGKSWLQITIFYIIFYGVLAAFFAVLLVLFLQTLDENEPKWQTKNGIIGTTPGLGFRPTPNDSGSTLIWLKQSQISGVGAVDNSYVQGLTTFLKPYEPVDNKGDGVMDCNEHNRPLPGDKRSCRVKLSISGNQCIKENNFGYSQGQPCVLLKLNRIYGWEPETYQVANLSAEVRSFYDKLTPKEPLPDNHVYITCNGEDPVDQEHIGPIRLYPRTIPAYYFPYLNQPKYLSPIVMVQFLNPTPGVLVNVECKAWARNIEHSRTDRLGQVHFEILVDR